MITKKKKTEVQHYFFSKNEHHIVCIVSGLHISWTDPSPK